MLNGTPSVECSRSTGFSFTEVPSTAQRGPRENDIPDERDRLFLHMKLLKCATSSCADRYVRSAIEHAFELTQKFIANMLGVRRQGVTAAAGEFQRFGVIPSDALCSIAHKRSSPPRSIVGRIARKLTTLGIASMQATEKSGVSPQLDLSLADYNTNGASISVGGDGTKFTFTIWPLSDAAVVALEGLAEKHGRIRLSCCRVPLLFDLVAVERKEPRKARIVGLIVGGREAG